MMNTVTCRRGDLSPQKRQTFLFLSGCEAAVF